MKHKIILKPGREKPLRRRHPWVFSGAVERVEGDPAMGETCGVHTTNGERVGWASVNPEARILGRVLSWDVDNKPDSATIRTKLEKAISARDRFLTPENDSVRLVYAESDGLPGVIVDRYGDLLVLQCLTAGAEYWRDTIVEQLVEITGVNKIYERSDSDARLREHLPLRKGMVRGEAPDGLIKITEYGLEFLVDIENGHKTGFYLDQARNRLRVQELANGKDVLNAFSYSDAFSVHALKGGAKSVVSVESSNEAIALGRENIKLNGIDEGAMEWIEGDVFKEFRTLRDRNRSFDMVILDPPKFAATAKQAEQASRGYKDINLLAVKLLRPGGLLVTFSCSGGVNEALFQKIVAGAALDAGADAQIIERLSQNGDHPVALNFPEGAYLKGLVVLRN